MSRDAWPARSEQGGLVAMVGLGQERICRECQRPFLFTAAEQAYYVEQGFSNRPQRCPACRGNRRRQREGLAPREMHEVTCASCGVPTAVPFVPRNARPVYCSFCFERERASRAPTATA